MTFAEQLQALAGLVLTIVLGGLIGYERETADKPAGFRTHMLIAGTAYLFVILGQALIGGYVGVEAQLSSDPLRIIESVMLGIAFVGAGTIVKQEQAAAVENLTTAASILMASTIGVSVGLRQYWLAGGITLIVLIVNRLLYYVKEWIGADVAEDVRQRHTD